MVTYQQTAQCWMKCLRVLKAYSLIECHICKQIKKAAEALGRAFTELPRVEREYGRLYRLAVAALRLQSLAEPCESNEINPLSSKCPVTYLCLPPPDAPRYLYCPWMTVIPGLWWHRQAHCQNTSSNSSLKIHQVMFFSQQQHRMWRTAV